VSRNLYSKFSFGAFLSLHSIYYTKGIDDNYQRYAKYARIASREHGAQIIVFPEDGLYPDPCYDGGTYMGARTGKRQLRHSFIPVTNHCVRLLPWKCCAYGACESVLTGYGAAHVQGGHL
jgi:hypothetical protein